MTDLDGLTNRGIRTLGAPPGPGPKTIVVAGVARGGTSIVAGTLANLGVFMGEQAHQPVFEDMRLAGMLEAADWAGVLNTIATYNEGHQTWGFKRPSVLSKLAPLHPLLRNPVYLFIFRDIMATANRDAISMKAELLPGMRRAQQAVSQMLDFIEGNDVSGLLLSAEKVVVRKGEFVDRLVAYLGLEEQITAQARQRAKDFITIDPADYLTSSHAGRLVFRGNVDMATPAMVAGWACIQNSPGAVALRIGVNGQEVGTTVANLPRPDVQARGFHHTGECGFRFAFPVDLAPAAGDEVTVTFVKGGRHLKWSPKRIGEPAGATARGAAIHPGQGEGPYLFVHVPKTAGTSFRLAVEQMSGGLVAYDYGEETPATGDAVREHVYRHPDLPALHRRLTRDQIVLFGGHVPYRGYAQIFAPQRVITFLRELIERVVSEYHHACRVDGFAGTLLEFADLGHHRNLQATMLDGVPLRGCCASGTGGTSRSTRRRCA